MSDSQQTQPTDPHQKGQRVEKGFGIISKWYARRKRAERDE